MKKMIKKKKTIEPRYLDIGLNFPLVRSIV